MREKILDAAELLMTRFGFGKVTMADIAREGCLSRATVYLHFQDKTEIGVACMDRLHFRVLNRLEEIAVQPGSAIIRLRRLLVGRVLCAFDAAQGATMKYEDIFAAIRPLYVVRRERYFEAEARLFLAALKDGIASAEIAVKNPPLTALVFVLASNALMPFNLSPRQLDDRSEVELRVSKLSEILLSGVINRSAKPVQRPGTADKPRNRRRIHVESK
jgi:AcrR family transcriptional regulator